MRILPILLICPFMTGCVAFAYPSTQQTPPLSVPETGTKAFRISTSLKTCGPWMTGPGEYNGSLEELPIHEGKIDAQRDAYFPYYYLAFPFAEGSYSRSFDVRLYRRGYETMVLEPHNATLAFGGHGEKSVGWKKAETLEAREKAIDDLTAGVHFHISPAIQVFLAEEYAEVAKMARPAGGSADEARKRLAEKAKSVGAH